MRQAKGRGGTIGIPYKTEAGDGICRFGGSRLRLTRTPCHGWRSGAALAYILGFGLMLVAHGGLTFTVGDRWAQGRQRQI